MYIHRDLQMSMFNQELRISCLLQEKKIHEDENCKKIKIKIIYLTKPFCLLTQRHLSSYPETQAVIQCTKYGEEQCLCDFSNNGVLKLGFLFAHDLDDVNSLEDRMRRKKPSIIPNFMINKWKIEIFWKILLLKPTKVFVLSFNLHHWYNQPVIQHWNIFGNWIMLSSFSSEPIFILVAIYSADLLIETA